MTDAATLTLAEAADALRISLRTAYRNIEESERDGIATLLPGVKAFRVRRHWRVSRVQLDRFLETVGDEAAS